jgi:hypothetical protein
MAAVVPPAHLQVGSVVNMFVGADPPSSFTLAQWTTLRDALYAKGNIILNGRKAKKQENKDAHEHRAWGIALAMNMLQESYHTHMKQVGAKGREVAEWALSILGFPSSLGSLMERIAAYANNPETSVTAVIDALHILRVKGNNAVHAETPPFVKTDKPLVANALYLVAKHVLDRLGEDTGGVVDTHVFYVQNGAEHPAREYQKTAVLDVHANRAKLRSLQTDLTALKTQGYEVDFPKLRKSFEFPGLILFSIHVEGEETVSAAPGQRANLLERRNRYVMTKSDGTLATFVVVEHVYPQ